MKRSWHTGLLQLDFNCMAQEIKGGIAAGGCIYVLLASHGEEDDQLVASGEMSRESLSVTIRAEISDLVSMIPLTTPFEDLGQVAALTGSGEIYFFTKTAVNRERLRKKGPFHGRMTTLQQIGDELFALGYGGQVFRRTSESNWTELQGPKNLVYFSIARFEDNIYFAGTEVNKFVENLDIKTASDRGDGRALARAILANKKPKMAILSKYDGVSWTQFNLEHQGAITAILPYRKSMLLFLTKGKIFSTVDFEKFDEVFSQKDSFSDIKLLENKIVILIAKALKIWNGKLTDFVPSLPAKAADSINISGLLGSLLAFTPKRILQVKGNSWAEINFGVSGKVPAPNKAARNLRSHKKT